MKNLSKYICESLHGITWLKNAKNVEEPFVKAALELEGWTVENGTQLEDFAGIDLIASRKRSKDDKDGFYVPGGKCVIDVKGSDSKNKKSNNFLLTTNSASGKEYPYKENGYFAFIDYVTKTIVLANQMDVKELCDKYTKRDSKFGDKSKYVLLPKSEVLKIGREIDTTDELKNMI